MKIAIVCDDLIQHGGAEKIVMQLCEMYPDAPLYTSVATKKWQEICLENDINLRTSFMQKLPLVKKLNRYYSPFLFHAIAFQSFNFDEFDIVLSVSARYAHTIITKPQTKHICYMNCPGRMFWESGSYFEHEEYGLLRPFKKMARPFLSLPLSHLRQWDFVCAQRVDYFIANSELIKNRIKKYYKRGSSIIYPFVDHKKFNLSKVKEGRGEYFLILTRLAPWKKIDISIKACNKLKIPLKVAGAGSDKKRLEELAGPTVDILGYISDKAKVDLYAKCKALIVTQEEDFGITPLEAMAMGKPVIAYGRGGVLETVIKGKTGDFFKKQTVGSLAEILTNFDEKRYGVYHCKDRSKKFSKYVFERKIRQFINAVFEESKKSGRI